MVLNVVQFLVRRNLLWSCLRLCLQFPSGLVALDDHHNDKGHSRRWGRHDAAVEWVEELVALPLTFAMAAPGEVEAAEVLFAFEELVAAHYLANDPMYLQTRCCHHQGWARVLRELLKRLCEAQ